MAYDAFMWFKDPKAGGAPIEGETQDDAMSAEKAFEIKSIEFGVKNPCSVGSETGGSGSGKPKHERITVTKIVDNATPAAWVAGCTGTEFGEAIISFREAGGAAGASSGAEFLRVELKKVFIEEYRCVGQPHTDGKPEETLKVAFGAKKLVYTPQAEGAMGTPAEHMYSVVKNTTTMDV